MRAIALTLLLLTGCSLLPSKHAAPVPPGAPHKMGAEIGSYPNASAQTGSERILEDQNSVTVNVTPVQLATYMQAVPLPTYTVATLPLCSSSTQYTWAIATDLVLATQAPYGPLTGGSNGVRPVFCNSVQWVSP